MDVNTTLVQKTDPSPGQVNGRLLFIANFNKGSNNNNGPSVIKKSKTQTIIPNNPSSNVKSKTLVGIASNIVVISTPKKNA